MLQLALSRHLRHFTAFTVLILGCAQAQSQEISACFPSVAVPKSDRKFLTGPRGPYPIGVWVCDWPAAYVTSEVVHILLEEILGFHVVQTGPGPNTVDAFFALAGCENPLNIEDRGCSAEPVVTTNHINVEGWTESYASTWAQIERDYPQNAPRNLGNMGYFGKTSMYLPTSIRRAAYNEEGLILEFYRGFNVSWTEPDKYFDPPSSINRDWLKPCVETRLMITQAMEEYATVTGDWDGVEIVDENGKNVTRGKCWNDYFWYPPACRDRPSKCVIFFTGGSGWNLEETMQKATAWNMPLGPAVAKTWGNFTQLPLQIDSVFYWWVPDPTFLSLDPVEITFPPFDRTAFRRGDKRTSPTALSVEKYVSQDLQTLAPEAHQLVRAMVMDLEAVNDMLRDQKKTGDSSRDVACRWLQGHEDVWNPWLPDPTKCFSGFGLYHQPSSSFVKDRQNRIGLACNPCPSGTFSLKLVDDTGITFVCEPCPAGSIQPSGASVDCVPCKAGEYQDVNGSISCKRCGMGEYQDETGATGCKLCPAETSTRGLGSSFPGDCGCKEGSINTANATGVVTCVACREGLRCPMGSSLESLNTGDKEFGEAFRPRILEGYFSTEEKPMEVFKCQAVEYCPGGSPGTCPGGREGIPCSECPSGTAWTGEECVQCSGGLVAVPIQAGSVFLLGLMAAYYLIPTRISAKATPREAISMCFGVVAGLVQCLAIIGLTSVRWPKAFESTVSSSSVVLLDMETFSLACMVGGPQWGLYIMSIAVFPLGAVWLLVCFTFSRCFKSCPGGPWMWARFLNTVGHFLQVGFSTMSALALQPMMCYQHPNGQHSLLKHAGVFCNTREHLVMLLAGATLLTFIVATFVGICGWAAWKIPRWSVIFPQRIPAFAFLISRFRMAIRRSRAIRRTREAVMMGGMRTAASTRWAGNFEEVTEAGDMVFSTKLRSLRLKSCSWDAAMALLALQRIGSWRQLVVAAPCAGANLTTRKGKVVRVRVCLMPKEIQKPRGGGLFVSCWFLIARDMNKMANKKAKKTKEEPRKLTSVVVQLFGARLGFVCSLVHVLHVFLVLEGPVLFLALLAGTRLFEKPCGGLFANCCFVLFFPVMKMAKQEGQKKKEEKNMLRQPMIRFRMDCWWYGVPVLLRGPLLSLCPVLATDFPPAQAAMATVVLMAGLLLHMRFLPWKMPMVNFVDGCLQSMLLFIVAITPAMGPGSATAIENFHEGIALVTLSCMVIILATLAFALAFASLYHLAGSASSAQDFIVLNLGRRQSSAEIVQHIKKVSQALLELEVERAKEVLDQMHPGDVSQIINTIELLRTELVQSMDEIRTRGNIASSRVTALRRSVKAQRNRMSDEHGENTLAKASDDPPASGENFFQTSANADPGEDAPTWTESLNEGFYDESRVVKAIL